MTDLHIDLKSVEIFPAQLVQEVTRQGGEVDQLVRGMAGQLLNVAIGLIGDRYSGQHPERGPKLSSTGSIEKGSSQGADWKVVFNSEIATLHHTGAGSHIIPFNGRPNFGRHVFLNNRYYNWGPRFVPVRHPGFKGNPYLIRAAQEIGLTPSGALRRGDATAELFRVPSSFM